MEGIYSSGGKSLSTASTNEEAFYWGVAKRLRQRVLIPSSEVRSLPPQPFQTITSIGKHDVARLMIFTGNANPELGNEIARSLGVSPSDAHVGLFSDGEINIEIRDNVRGHDIFIVCL